MTQGHSTSLNVIQGHSRYIKVIRGHTLSSLQSHSKGDHQKAECRHKRFIILGLAASLHARVLAQFKVEEENEERRRHHDISTNTIPTNQSTTNIQLTPTHIQTEGLYCSISTALLFRWAKNNLSFCTCIAAMSLKRSSLSPISQHHRQAKIHHFDDAPSDAAISEQSVGMELMSPEINSLTSDEHNSHIRLRNDDGEYLSHKVT